VTAGATVGRGGPALPPTLIAEVRDWMARDPDPVTRAELERMLATGEETELRRRFDRPLAFGTAGLRGPLGAGPARMNRAVVRATTAGLVRWALDQGGGAADAGIVVGRDNRHGSNAFAADTAAVAAAAGVRVLVLERPLPTPITAFAVRHLAAAAGVMITASHNPPTDNGYKVYAADGAPIIPPDDARIAGLAAGLGPPLDETPSFRRAAPIERLDEAEILGAYAGAVTRILEARGPRRLRIVYTPLHGVGGAVLPDLLVSAGFEPPVPVALQAEPDPDFPTVPVPNPEVPGTLDLAIAEADRVAADIVLANDPDADRLAVAAVDPRSGGFRVLTGDELGSLLGEHLLARGHDAGRLVASTVVSSSLLAALAAEAGVAYVATLTGFKWVARAGRAHPGRHLVFGYEEALGYAVSDAVADKDGLSAALVAAELAAAERAAGRTLYDRLDDIEARLGVHVTAQISLQGGDGGENAAFDATMASLRARPPTELAGLLVTEVVDYTTPRGGLPPANVIAWHLGTTARVVVRPSGTEPKLKTYLEVVTEPPGRSGLAVARQSARRTLRLLRRDVRAALSDRDGLLD